MKRDFLSGLKWTVLTLLGAILLTSIGIGSEAWAIESSDSAPLIYDFVINKQKKKCEKLQFNPDPVNFGEVPIGTTATIKLTVTNPATNTTTADIVGLGGPNHPFAIESTEGCPGKLAPGQMCTVTITFSPTHKKHYSSKVDFHIMGCPAEHVKLEGDGVVAPSPSPTRTSSPTPGASPSPTPTRTASPSPTPTASATPTRTSTPTASPSATPTATTSATPSVSSSPSASATASPTASPTPLPVSYGNCMSTLTIAHPNVQHPAVDVDGNFVVAAYDNGTDVIYVVSTDGGKTWSSEHALTANPSGTTATAPQVLIGNANGVPFANFVVHFVNTTNNLENISYIQVNLTNTSTSRGPTTILNGCQFPAIAVDSTNDVFAACGASSNDVFYTASFNGGPFSPQINVFGPTAQLNVPTVAALPQGAVVVTGQGLNSNQQQSIFGAFSPDGKSFGAPFPIYSADPNDSLFFDAPNTFFSGNSLSLFANETTSSTGFLVNVFGNPAAQSPTFNSVRIGQAQVGQSFSFTPAGFPTNPGALSVAIIARNASNSVDLVQSKDLTNASAYTSIPLDNNNDFQLGAAGDAAQGIFAIVGQGIPMTVYRCPGQ